jgi:hypothetical protein
MQVDGGYFITTHQVLKLCEIRSGKTLTRWRQAGLLPLPAIETHPSGKGKIAYYPVWICDWIRWVRHKLAMGASLDEIAKTTNVDWTASHDEIIEVLNEKGAFRSKISDLWNLHNSSFAEFMADMFAGLCSQRLYFYLKGLGIQRPGIEKSLEARLADPVLFTKLMYLVGKKKSPVLVLLNDKVDVIASTSLSLELSRKKSQGKPLLVMPVLRLAFVAFAAADQFQKNLVDKELARMEKRRTISPKRKARSRK